MYGVPDYQYAQPGGYQQSRYPSAMQYSTPQMAQINQSGMNMGMNMQGQQPMPILKGRPVSSFSEAEASMIDLDGSLFVFTDIANKKIYTKRCLLDGSAEMKVYSLVEENKNTNMIPVTQDQDYVLRVEFDKILTQINKRFNDMEVLRHDAVSDDV